jgi:copper transport protein
VRRASLAIALTVATLSLLGGVAAAHANYVKSNPASDARLAKAPAEVRVTFSEQPDPRGSDLAVLDANGKRVDKADVTAVSDEANTLRVSVGDVGEGGYLVSWSARSAVDGHETKGAFAFAIGNAPLPKIPDIGPSAPPPTPLELAGRALSFAGFAVLIGLSFFTMFISVPEAASELQRERGIVIAGGALLIVGSALLLAAQGTSAPPRYAALIGLRALAGAAAIAALALPRRLVPLDARREAIGFVGLAAGLTATLVSHAAASGDLRYVALDYLHVIAISVWAGGVVSFVALLPTWDRDERGLGGVVWRFSLTALVAVAVIVTTGTLQALDRLVLIEDLVETPYGIALLAKVLLLVGLLAFGSLNLFVWGPRLRRGVPSRAAFARGILGETLLFAAVIVAAAFLTAFAPPAQASAAAFDETKHVSGLRIELLTATTLPGRNRYVVRVQQGLAPVTEADKVALRFTMVEHDMGEQELVGTERAPGEYVTEGSPTAMFGTWKIETIVRLAGRQDVHALFTVPITQPAGQGATSKVIAVPPYQLIVFSDPFQPQAGAPVTINVVVVDAKGDPVTGKQVRATFSGPGTQPPVDGVENAAELGPGRYRFALSGLEAGSWKVTLSISGAGSGVYDLDVTR